MMHLRNLHSNRVIRKVSEAAAAIPGQVGPGSSTPSHSGPGEGVPRGGGGLTDLQGRGGDPLPKVMGPTCL